jgi:hypothetical protein
MQRIGSAWRVPTGQVQSGRSGSRAALLSSASRSASDRTVFSVNDTYADWSLRHTHAIVTEWRSSDSWRSARHTPSGLSRWSCLRTMKRLAKVGREKRAAPAFAGFTSGQVWVVQPHRRSRDWLPGGAFDSSARDEANMSLTAQVMEQSQIEVGVQGPGSANRLFCVRGGFNSNSPETTRRFGFSLARPSSIRNSSRRAPPPGSRSSAMAARRQRAWGSDSK